MTEPRPEVPMSWLRCSEQHPIVFYKAGDEGGCPACSERRFPSTIFTTAEDLGWTGGGCPDRWILDCLEKAQAELKAHRTATGQIEQALAGETPPPEDCPTCENGGGEHYLAGYQIPGEACRACNGAGRNPDAWGEAARLVWELSELCSDVADHVNMVVIFERARMYRVRIAAWKAGR